MDKIDLVIDWLDETDQAWQEDKAKYDINVDNELNDDTRYRDYGTFKYVFRSIEKYATWVNKIYVVTNGQVPEFLDLNNPKIQLIKHEDYIDSNYLPTFNSNVIETNYDKISGLSEQFVLLNDDVYFNSETSADEFFVNGKPTDYGIIKPQITFENFFKVVFNNLIVINKHFTKKEMLANGRGKFSIFKYGMIGFKNNLLSKPWSQITGFYDAHGPASILKSTMKQVKEVEPEVFKRTSEARFRSSDDINQWLFRYWQIASGNFEPRKMTFEKLINLKDIKSNRELFKNKQLKAICVNDVTENFSQDITILQDLLEKKFPNKSEFEK